MAHQAATPTNSPCLPINPMPWTSVRTSFRQAPRHLSEKSIKEALRPRRESHGVSVFANPEAIDRLDSWKEIASHLKRTVRTVQRWERREGLPVHRHLHQRANSVYARKLELDEWWNHEPHSRQIEPPQIFSEGSRRHVTVIHSEEERPESNPSPSGRLAECVQELREAEICSPEDRTCHVVCVLRVRIRIVEYLLQPGLERTTRDAKAPCRSLSLALPGNAP